MKSLKKIAIFALTVMIAAGVCTIPKKSSAEVRQVSLIKDVGTANKGQVLSWNYSVDKEIEAYGILYASSPMKISIEVYDGDTCIDSLEDDKNSEYWYKVENNDNLYYYAFSMLHPFEGNYQIRVTFGKATTYMMDMYTFKDVPQISDEKIEITKGFYYRLSVSNPDGDIKWSSSDEEIAHVGKKGKVTGKQEGKVVVTAELGDGTKLTCDVTIKDNVYTGKKYTISDVDKGKVRISVYQMSYGGKGNLRIKAQIVNNKAYKAVKIGNLKFDVRDADGKVIGKLTVKTKKVSIPARKSKFVIFTIDKSKFKIKNADLRIAQCKINSDASVYFIKK